MTDKKQGYQPETVIATSPPNCKSGVITPPFDGMTVKELMANAEKCLEAFEVRDIITRQQETINRQKAEIERLNKLLDDKCIEEEKVFSVDIDIHSIKAEAKKEVFEELISMCNAPHWCVWLSEIANLAEKMGVKVDAD